MVAIPRLTSRAAAHLLTSGTSDSAANKQPTTTGPGEPGTQEEVMSQLAPESHAGSGRVNEFVERFTVWMKEIATVSDDDPTLVASLVDLMKDRLAADLERFVETELRLRAFERRAPDQEPFLQLIEKAG
jgi:hypothetical protein